MKIEIMDNGVVRCQYTDEYCPRPVVVSVLPESLSERYTYRVITSQLVAPGLSCHIQKKESGELVFHYQNKLGGYERPLERALYLNAIKDVLVKMAHREPKVVTALGDMWSTLGISTEALSPCEFRESKTPSPRM